MLDWHVDPDGARGSGDGLCEVSVKTRGRTRSRGRARAYARVLLAARYTRRDQEGVYGCCGQDQSPESWRERPEVQIGRRGPMTRLGKCVPLVCSYATKRDLRGRQHTL